jgi:hypothetical protein
VSSVRAQVEEPNWFGNGHSCSAHFFLCRSSQQSSLFAAHHTTRSPFRISLILRPNCGQPFPLTRGIRKGWRGQVTLANGIRPHADFDTSEEAANWITDTLAKRKSDKQPLLGGPTQATLCDMLEHYRLLWVGS